MATALVIEGGVLGNDGQGQIVQAVTVPPPATHNVTYTTSAATGQFQRETRIVTVCSVGAACYVKFGKEGVTAGTGGGDFDGWLPANSVIAYTIDPRHVDRVAVYDGSS